MVAGTDTDFSVGLLMGWVSRFLCMAVQIPGYALFKGGSYLWSYVMTPAEPEVLHASLSVQTWILRGSLKALRVRSTARTYGARAKATGQEGEEGGAAQISHDARVNRFNELHYLLNGTPRHGGAPEGGSSSCFETYFS